MSSTMKRIMLGRLSTRCVWADFCACRLVAASGTSARGKSSFCSWINYLVLFLYFNSAGLLIGILRNSCFPWESAHILNVPVQWTSNISLSVVRLSICTVAGDRYFSCMPITAQPLRMGQRWNRLSVNPDNFIFLSDAFNTSAALFFPVECENVVGRRICGFAGAFP